MDIAALSMGMAQSRLMSSVGYAVLGNVLDSMESTGSQNCSAPHRRLLLWSCPSILISGQILT